MVQRIRLHGGPGSGRATFFGLGRSFLRCEEESDKGGGGGESAKDGAANGEQSKESEKRYTAAEVADIVKDRLAREKRKAPEPEKKTAKESSGDPSWFYDLQDAIDEAQEVRDVKIPLGLKKRMRSAFAADKPSDPSAWVGQWLDDVGLVKKSTEKTNTDTKAADTKNETKTQTSQQNGKSISDKGTANVNRDPDDFDPRDMTEVDVERLYEKHGVDKANDLITKKVLSWLSTVKFVRERPGPRR